MLASMLHILEAHNSRGRRSWQLKISVLTVFFVNVNKCAKYFLNLKRCRTGAGHAQMVLPYSVLSGAAESGPQRQDVQVKKEETQEEREAEPAAHGGGHEARHGGKGNLRTEYRIQCSGSGQDPKSD
jgi:hypothetical protein